MALLTDTRRAVWAAIDLWPALSVIKRKYKFEDRPGRMGGEIPTPTAGDLPALSIWPAEAGSKWVLNQSQKATYALEFTLWTKEWQLPEAELYWEEILKCLFHALSGGLHRVEGWTVFTGQLVQTQPGGGSVVNATQWKWTVTISAGFWNPKTAS